MLLAEPEPGRAGSARRSQQLLGFPGDHGKVASLPSHPEALSGEAELKPFAPLRRHRRGLLLCEFQVPLRLPQRSAIQLIGRQ